MNHRQRIAPHLHVRGIGGLHYQLFPLRYTEASPQLWALGR